MGESLMEVSRRPFARILQTVNGVVVVDSFEALLCVDTSEHFNVQVRNSLFEFRGALMRRYF